jgi:hypothetical protein
MLLRPPSLRYQETRSKPGGIEHRRSILRLPLLAFSATYTFAESGVAGEAKHAGLFQFWSRLKTGSRSGSRRGMARRSESIPVLGVVNVLAGAMAALAVLVPGGKLPAEDSSPGRKRRPLSCATAVYCSVCF